MSPEAVIEHAPRHDEDPKDGEGRYPNRWRVATHVPGSILYNHELYVVLPVRRSRLTYQQSQELLENLRNIGLDKAEAVTEADLYDCLTFYTEEVEDEDGRGRLITPEVELFERKALFARVNSYVYGSMVANLYETSDEDIRNTQDQNPAEWREEMEKTYRRDILGIQ